MHGPCERCGSSRHSDGNCPNPRPVAEDVEGDLRRALVRALDDVKRGNENIETLLAELKAERAAWSAIKAYINVRSGQPTMSRACEDILDEMDRLERP
jgi:hypothetical protein